MAKKHTRLLCGIAALSLLAAMVTGCGQKPEQSKPTGETQVTTQPAPQEQEPIQPSYPLVTEPEDPPYTEPPTEPPVQVVMPQYELTYSGELADVIFWEEQETAGSLRFSVKLSGGNAALFTLLLNQSEGELVVMKENGAGEKIPVSFLMESMPDGLSEADQQAFCLAQDQVNDIIATLTLK